MAKVTFDRKLEFRLTDAGCLEITNRTAHINGYPHVVFSPAKGFEDGQELFHLYIWRTHYGPIPEGYVVHHKCRNRKCGWPGHLKLMLREEHNRMHMKEIWKERKAALHF